MNTIYRHKEVIYTLPAGKNTIVQDFRVVDFHHVLNINYANFI